MFVSVRRRFRRGDEGWNRYQEFIDLPHLSEVRTIDSSLNDYAPHEGDLKCTPETLAETVDLLVIPDPRDEYCLLAINLTKDTVERIPDGWKLLGHDLADETHTSSLLNCEPWEGKLKPFTERLNVVGLLSRADAELARQILPMEFGECDHHAHADVWALYERE